MKIKILLTFVFTFSVTWMNAQTRHWEASDGLPTGEVRQIIPLPNHQMLVNCEGVFCISNGKGFTTVVVDRRKVYSLQHYNEDGYAYLWQGDSLLWLRDFYRIYLFDMRTRSFRYDINNRLQTLGPFKPSPKTVTDWQGGKWTGTIGNGIEYTPPARKTAEIIEWGDTTIGVARHAAELDVKFDDRRRLQCRELNQLGYYLPEEDRFVLLNAKLPKLNDYRHIVGACAIDREWIVIYTQNGACMLNTHTDTLATFQPAEVIKEYTDKYNCIIQGRDGILWIGTQNGLFKQENGKIVRIEGLKNNCIRSLVLDAKGNVWAGTACGISRITPTVINFGEEDGIPPVSMMERAACLTDDGRLVFVHHTTAATVFCPEWLESSDTPEIPVLTSLLVNGRPTTESRQIDLPHAENYLTFQFSALDYACPSHIRYRYRLRGLEEEWHICFDTKGFAEADYKALPPGEYVFEAQAAADDGKWSDSLTFSVVVRPPWWLTWWAKLIYGLIGLLVLFALIGLYLKKKRKALEREDDDRVNKLFERREQARHQFAENTQIDPKKIGVNEEEERLTTRLLAAIEAHIDDEEYGVDQLAADVALSRTNLYGKLRNMLGISPADFIRNVRLKRAAQLLTDHSTLSVAEVASRVGFATARNFSTQFKKMFGMLPSEYRNPT